MSEVKKDFRAFLDMEVPTPGGKSTIRMEDFIKAIAEVTRTWLANSGSHEGNQMKIELASRAPVAITTMLDRIQSASIRPLTNNDRLQEIFDDGIAAFAVVRDSYSEMHQHKLNEAVFNVNKVTEFVDIRIQELREKHFPKGKGFVKGE